MSLFATDLACANQTLQDYRTFCPPYSGAKWIRVAEFSRYYLIALKRRFTSRLSRYMKGLLQLNELEYFGSNFESRLRGKNSPALNRLPHTQPSLPQCGSTLEYLIGQQRLQSMPHRAAKSRANLS